jgi:flagellar hook-associated protein 3 FlgL
VAAAAEVQNQARSDAVDQYTANTTTVLNMVQTADSSLSSVVTQLTQAVTLGTEAASGTVNTSQQQTILQQVQGIIQNVVAEANTSYHGLYLFAGTNTTAAPFAADSSDSSGYKYNGNDGVNSVEIGEGLNIAVNVPGDQIFQNANGSVLGSLQQLATALQSGSSTDIGNATSAVNTALNVVSQKQALYGSAESQLTSQQTALQQQSTNLTTEETNLVGADLAQTTVLFTQATLANQAALAAAARVLPETLLDYLK